mgnify:CR=1 FL=1
MENTQKNNRKYFLDIAKGIGIVFVMLGHSAIGESIASYTYIFNMPMFFFVAGYLTNLAKYQNYWQFLKSRLKGILIPYLGLSIISVIFYKFYYRMPGNDYITIQNMLKVFVLATRNQIFYNIPLWFLPTLFITENIFYWIRKINRWWLELIIMFILGWYFVMAWDTLYNPKLFWTLDNACFYLIFLALGYYVRNKFIDITKLNWWVKNAMWIIMLSINLLVIVNKTWFDKIFRNKALLNNSMFYYISLIVLAVAGIWSILKISKIINRQKILEFIGRNSLTFFGLHVLVFWILDKILKPMPFWQDRLLMMSIVYVVITIGIISLLIKPLKKCLPSVFGKN